MRATIALVLACGLSMACSPGHSAVADPTKSTATVDSTTGVIADGRDRVTISVTTLSSTGFPAPGVQVVLSATGTGNTIIQPVASDAFGLAIGTIASTVPGLKTITVTLGGQALAQTIPVTFVAIPETKLTFKVPPSAALAGDPINPTIEVGVEDAAGNLITSATDAITLTLAPSTGTLTGSATTNAVAGIATFAGLSISQVGAAYQLTATADGLANAISAPFAITASPPSKLAFLVQPSNSQTGSIITPPLQVAVQDNLGNLEASATGTVTIAIGTQGGRGVLYGTATQPVVGGIAKFDDLNLRGAGNGYVLVATSAGASAPLAGARSIPFNVAVGAASHTSSTLVATATSAGTVVADGVSTYTITTTVLDPDWKRSPRTAAERSRRARSLEPSGRRPRRGDPRHERELRRAAWRGVTRLPGLNGGTCRRCG